MKELLKEIKTALPDYAKLLLVRPGKAPHLMVVLCQVDEPWGSKFVTWRYNRQTRGVGNGRYFVASGQKNTCAQLDSLEKAIENFKERD